MKKTDLKFSLGKIIRISQEILSSDYGTEIPNSFSIKKSNMYAVSTLDCSSVYISLRRQFHDVKEQLIEREIIAMNDKHVTVKDGYILRYNFDLIESLIIPELIVFHYLKPSDHEIWKYFREDFRPRLSKRIADYVKKNGINIFRPYTKGEIIPKGVTNTMKEAIQDSIMGQLLNDLSFFFLQNAFITKKGKNIRSYAVNLGKEFPSFKKLKASVHKRSKWPDELWPMFFVEDCDEVDTAFSVWLDTYIAVKSILSKSTPDRSNSWKYYTKYHQITNNDLDKVKTYLSSLFPGAALIGTPIRRSDKIYRINLEYELAQFAINFYDYDSYNW